MVFLLALGIHAYAQSGSNSGSINGTVLDPTGAVVPNATVEIHNPVSHFDRSTTTDKSGNFSLPNIPFNPYHMTVTATGFAPNAQDVEIRSIVPVSLNISLQVSGSTTSVTVEAGGRFGGERSDLPLRHRQEACSTSFPWKARHRH